nr:protein FAR1-RELATED SEQUENCE 5-like [Ipomoea batatas]
MEVSPKTTKTWIPMSVDEYRPYVGCQFKTLGDGVQLYRSYASVGGFDIKQSTMKKNKIGEITMKYLVCSRQGFKGSCGNKLKITEEGDGIITKQRQRKTSNRVGCNVKVLKEMKAKLLLDSKGHEQVKGNKSAIEALCGVVALVEIFIKAPVQAKNKGSGKCIKEKIEIAIE